MATRGTYLTAFLTAALLAGCHRGNIGRNSHGNGPSDTDSASPPVFTFTGKLIPAKPHKPYIGDLEIGVFASEVADALRVEKISIGAFHSDALYDRYRVAVRDIYGADLSDMNYFSIGHKGWAGRIPDLRHWLIRASAYGAPTLALEPLGPMHYDIFADSPDLSKLRAMFEELNQKHITVWIRFASEANLFGSQYSVSKSDEELQKFKAAARWWKGYMPPNAKLVFSPLVNTPYEAHMMNSAKGVQILAEMYEKGVWDRIGGTLYSTTNNVNDMYDWYVSFMRQIDPNTPLQVCELGGPLTHKNEIVTFLNNALKGRWKGLQKITLFGGQVNSRAQKENGRFGFVEPGQSVSYIRQIYFPDSLPSSSAHSH